MENNDYHWISGGGDFADYEPEGYNPAGYERLEGPLMPHEAGDSYCKKFCNKPTDNAIHDYEEDPEEFGF